MHRPILLIAACLVASVSVGLNVWFLLRRPDNEPGRLPRAAAPAEDVVPARFQPVQMDFSGTAFADDSWKLSGGDQPAGGVPLEKPFSWDDAAVPPSSR